MNVADEWFTINYLGYFKIFKFCSAIFYYNTRDFFKVFIKNIKKPDIMVAYYPCGEIVCDVIYIIHGFVNNHSSSSSSKIYYIHVYMCY